MPKATVYYGGFLIERRDFAVAVKLFVDVETAAHRLLGVMRKDPKDKHLSRLFECFSGLRKIRMVLF